MKDNILVAFDFDHTLIDDNSDVRVQSLAVDGYIPDKIRKLRKTDGWILFMNGVFQLLHQQGTTPKQILDCIVDIKWTQGMIELLHFLDQKSYEMIIISDSNSVFIDAILNAANVHSVFKGIFTNNADFDENGCLRVYPYHHQDWCNLSTENMCKGDILTKYVSKRKEQGVEFGLIAYVGDGANDMCPSLRLSESDLIFGRKGYSLLTAIHESCEKPIAKVIPWDSGYTIMDYLRDKK